MSSGSGLSRPLVALKLLDGRWATLLSEEGCRGLVAEAIVFLREPSPAERESIEECLSHHGGPIAQLDALLVLAFGRLPE
jgi:hypothetical protein